MVSRFSDFWAHLPGTTRAIALMVVSTLAFSGMHASVRHVAAELHPIEIAFFRNFFGLIVFLPWFLRQGLEPLRTRQIKLHALRAVINVCAMFAFFTALSLAPLAQVTALAFTAPIFAALLAMVVLGEVFRLRRWAAIVVGFAGTVVILRPGLQALDTGSLLTLLSALLWGCTLIVIKVLARSESSITITSYMNILLAILSLVPAILVWRTPSVEGWLWLLLIGVSGTLAQALLAQALKEAETGLVMPFDFCKLIWASVLGYLWFAEWPDLFVWTGGAMIFGGATYIAYRESQLARAARRRDDAAETRPQM